MKINILIKILMISIVLLSTLTSCERDVSTLELATYPQYGEVFLDGFPGGLDYQAFLNSKLDALQIENFDVYNGSRAMVITVPSEGDPDGWFAGGAFISPPRDLSGYNALTFYAKSSQAATIGLVGFGNDNTGESMYMASITDVTFTTTWKKYIIPIPNPDKLTAEAGMFQYAIGADENGNGFQVWFDEVRFEKLGTLAHPQADLGNRTLVSFIGDTIDVGEVQVKVSGSDAIVNAMPAYLDFYTDNEDVLKIENNVITVIGAGEAQIKAKLGDLEAVGSINVEVGGITVAPKPQFPAEDVISLFSNEYDNVQVDTWNPYWQYSTTLISEVQIGSDDLIQYTKLNFVGVEFVSQTLDVTDMTHFHMHVWTPDPSAIPAAFRVELVDFGADNAYGGGDDSSHMYIINADTTPKLVSEEWITIDVPLSELTGLKSVKNLAQMVISSADFANPNTVFIDNVLFHK